MATASHRSGGKLPPPVPGASEQIALQIRRHLEQRDLAPGDRLGTEQELAAQFGVSRPTLREALRLLSASQLIRVGRGRAGGIFVARTPNEGLGRNVSESIGLMLAAGSVSLDELLDARLSLEVPLAGRAAEHADDEVVRRLEEAVSSAVGHAPGTPPFDEADARFHQVLADAAGNDLLRALAGWILEVLQPALVARLAPSADADAILAQHRAILRAVSRHQRRAAEKAMQEHIEDLGAQLAAASTRRRAARRA